MSEHNPEDLEALRLNLAQVAAAPDTWRARAVAAGGFLGAAAAVSLWGLSQQAAKFSGGIVVWVAAAAALFYVLAVIGFLVAGVLPTPQPDPDSSGTIADQLHAFAHKETKPIKRVVLVSAVFGSLAIVATTLGSFLVLLSPIRSNAMVSIVDEEQRTAVQRLCPGLSDPFRATVRDDGSEVLRLRVLGVQCGKHRPELAVDRSGVLRLESDPS